jgi:RimJ/RimL family protein N-acetyltransferase
MIWWPNEIPTIQHGQFTLRPLADTDIDPIYSSCQDPIISKFTTIAADYPRAMAEGFVRVMTRQLFDKHKAIHFAFTVAKVVSPNAILINGETFLGTFSIHGIEEDNHLGEIGYWLNKEVRGNGFATVGSEMLTNYAFETVGFRRLAGLVDFDNMASKKVLTNAGYSLEGVMKSRKTRADGSQIDMDLFAASSDTWTLKI